MHVELVKAWTEDRLLLDGSWRLATRDDASLAADAVLCLHGVGGNFYGSRLFQTLSDRFFAKGVSVLRVNTRGHDGIALAATTIGARQVGAAYELIHECQYDIAAWLDFLADRGMKRVVVLGHSLGAIKAVFHLSKLTDWGTVSAGVFVSPPVSLER